MYGLCTVAPSGASPLRSLPEEGPRVPGLEGCGQFLLGGGKVIRRDHVVPREHAPGLPVAGLQHDVFGDVLSDHGPGAGRSEIMEEEIRLPDCLGSLLPGLVEPYDLPPVSMEDVRAVSEALSAP